MTLATGASPTLGLAVIARDEAATLPNLLRSVDGVFDQVVLLDTGSIDRTVAIFEEWAESQRLPLGHRVDHFEWCDDFAAARNAANDLLDTDWLAWADCDERFRGAGHLRDLIAGLPPHAAVLRLDWTYCGGWQDQAKDRFVRRGFEGWIGRVHEGQPARAVHWASPGSGAVHTATPRTMVATIHGAIGERNQRPFGVKYQRNISIINRWAADLPGHPTPAAYRVTEEMSRGSHEQGVEYARGYLALPRVRKDLGAERVAVAESLLPALPGPFGRAFDYVMGRPPLTWLVMDEHPDLPPHPLCPDPGAALLELAA